MSEFDEPKKRISTPTQPTFRHHHRRKVAATASSKGAVAPHHALNSLPPERHALTLGQPLASYRDLPRPTPAPARAPSSETPPPTLQDLEKMMPPPTANAVLSDYLRAAKELLSGRQP